SHLKDSTSPATGDAKASATGTTVLKVRCRNYSGRDTTQFQTSHAWCSRCYSVFDESHDFCHCCYCSMADVGICLNRRLKISLQL
ncbi:hypothetical protein CIB84_003491, partial [Bambusicola thoracicus]